MLRSALIGSLALTLAACTSPQEAQRKQAPEKKAVDGNTETPETPETPKEPEPPKEPLAQAAIASVQMIEDCPDDNGTWRPPPPPASKPAAAAPASPPAADEPAPAQAPAKAARSAAKPMMEDMDIAPGAMAEGVGGGGFEQPCTQSTMQLAFTGQGNVESTVKIEQVRLLDSGTGKKVGTVKAREPASWVDGAYQSWNETIAPKQEIKSSYELSVPDWNEVEEAIGGKSSFGTMFILEVDVKVGDELQTVRSAQFPRERPHVIVT